MLQLLEIVLGALGLYAVLATLAWRFQDRIAFPSPRGPLPVPAPRGLEDAEPVALKLRDGTRLAGWYLPPIGAGRGRTESDTDRLTPPQSAPGLLWFYGNGETIAAIWPVLRDFRPSGTAVLVVDYPGYGASEGRASEAALYEAADLAYATLVARAGIDPARVHVYGRSLGTVVATHVAVTHTVAGLVLESPFTNALEMSRRHYALFPGFLLRLRLDNLDTIRRVRCPVLVFHGTEDWLVPLDMGRRVAAAAPGPVELVLIDGAGHNDTYAMGGTAYRDKVWDFVRVRS